MVMRGIMVISSQLNVNGNVTHKCPKHLNSFSFYTSHKKWVVGSEWRNIYTSVESRCEACGPERNTLHKGFLTIHPIVSDEWSQQSSPEVCYSCPPGARCNGNIIPLENHWGYKKSEKEIIFTQCPSGYCCSADTTPCLSYDTCRKGRAGLLCGSCDDEHKLSFLNDGCIPKGKPCNLGKNTLIAAQ